MRQLSKPTLAGTCFAPSKLCGRFLLAAALLNSLLLPLTVQAENAAAQNGLDSADSAVYQDSDAGLALLSDDNLLIVDIFLGDYRLAADVFIYTSPEATVIPLQPLFDAVEFPIEVDPVALKAHGWFLRESNEFDLNTAKQQVIVGDQTLQIADKALILSDDIDLYADIRLLKQWFPFEVELQTSRLRVNISSKETLPLEQQLQREKQRQRSLHNAVEEGVAIKPDHYRALGVPTLDINIGGVIRDAQSTSDIGINAISAADVDLDFSYSMQASVDILGLQGSLAVSRSSNDADTDERFTLYKRPNSPEQNMHGQLGYAAIGDVFAASDGLVFSGGDGLGAEFQFGGVRRATDFDKRVIEGEATPNWEVELYRNGALVDFQIVGEDARYRFEDVPVEYGENIFDIRLFGPQGQEQSQRESIRVGDQALPKGEFYGRANHVNLDQSVFEKPTANIGTQTSVQDESKSQVFVQVGVSDWLSTSVTLSEHQNVARTETDNQYMELGLTAALPFAAIALSHASLQDGGSASLFSTQTRLGETSISYSHKHYDKFVSDRNPGDRLRDDVELRLTGNISPFNLNPLSYQITGNYNSFSNDGYDYSINNRVGFQLFNGRLTLENEFRDGNFAQQSLNGSARYLRAIGSRTNIRASVNYSVEPDTRATGASTSITWRPNSRMRTQLAINGDFTDNDNNNLALSMSYIFKGVTLSTNSFIQEGGGASFLLNAEFSLGRENNKRWKFKNQSQSNYGRLKARAFLDKDQDGLFSTGDQALAGVRFAGRQDWKDLATGDDGIVYLTGLRTDHPTTVELDKDSLEDPYLRSKFDKAAFVSHPGGLQTVDIPITVTVEAEGSVLLQKGVDKLSARRPLAGLPLLISDANGDTVASTVSEFDGFFIIEGLNSGEYQLSIPEQALEKLNVQHFQPIFFTAVADAGVVYLEPIVLISGDTNIRPTTNGSTSDIPMPDPKPLISEDNLVTVIEDSSRHSSTDKNSAIIKGSTRDNTIDRPTNDTAKAQKESAQTSGNILHSPPQLVAKTARIEPANESSGLPQENNEGQSQAARVNNKQTGLAITIPAAASVDSSTNNETITASREKQPQRLEDPRNEQASTNQPSTRWRTGNTLMLLGGVLSGLFFCRFFYRIITGKP